VMSPTRRHDNRNTQGHVSSERAHRPNRTRTQPHTATAERRHSYVSHLIENGVDPLFVQLLLSPISAVHDVQHETETTGGLRPGGGYLASSITQIPRRFDVGSTGLDARLVG
jgi:hypothetical protein